jgi:hypothetical protein
MCGFLLGGNAHLLHFSWGETRMCCISPGQKVACVALSVHLFVCLLLVGILICLSVCRYVYLSVPTRPPHVPTLCAAC